MITTKKSIPYIVSLMLTLLPISLSFGQNVLYDFNNLLSEYSIVRNHKPNVDITFDAYLSSKKFSYVDRATNTCYHFETYVSVYDFKVLNDTVYFCGNDWEHSCLAVGWFSIPGAFSGTDGVYCFSIPMPVFSSIGVFEDYFSWFSKMDILRIDGIVHYFITGVGRQYSNNGNLTAYHDFIADIYGNPTGSSLTISYTMDYSDQFKYDDIAVTSNYMVVAGRKLQDSRYAHVVFPYSLQTTATANQSIFKIASGYNPMNHLLREDARIIDTTIFYPRDAMRITAMTSGTDEFATVCKTKDGFVGSGKTAVNIFNTPSSINTQFTFVHGINHSYKEVCYNAVSQGLYMLPDHIPNILIYVQTPYMQTVTNRTWGNFNWLSIDEVHGTDDNVLSGTTYDDTFRKLWLQNNHLSNDCVTEEFNATTSFINEQRLIRFDQCVCDGSADAYRHQVDVISDTMTLKCNDTKQSYRY